MKTKAQVEEELLRIEAKIEDAKITGRGYATFSQLRADETRANTLKWVLQRAEPGQPRK